MKQYNYKIGNNIKARDEKMVSLSVEYKAICNDNNKSFFAWNDWCLAKTPTSLEILQERDKSHDLGIFPKWYQLIKKTQIYVT